MKNIKKIYRNLPEGELKNLISKIYRKNRPDKPKFPSYVQIEPTTRCNLNCVMCMRNYFLKRKLMKNGDMSFENFRKILDKIPSTEELDIQGVGEPFLNKDIIKMIKYAKGKGIRTYTVTNATLIGNIEKDIVKSGLDILKISFYGATTEVYEKIMINSKMKKVIENVKRLDEAKNKYKSKTPVLELTVGCMHENLKDLPKLPKVAKDMGIKKLIIGEIYGYGKPLVITDKVSKIIEKVKDNCKKFDLENVINIPNEVYDYTKNCLWPWVATYITWDGYIKPCCSRPYFVNLKLGNILSENFEDIWNNKKYINFRIALKSKNVPFMCRGCQYDFTSFGVTNGKKSN